MAAKAELGALLEETIILSSTSIFGRLRAISALYDSKGGCYEHPLASSWGAVAVDTALRELHSSIFGQWIGMSMRLQSADLKIYLARLSDRKGILDGLPEIAKRLLPPDLIDVERDVFLQDVSWIHVLLRRSEE